MRKPEPQRSATVDTYPETEFASFVPIVVRDFIVGHRKCFLDGVLPELVEVTNEKELEWLKWRIDRVLSILQLLASDERMKEVYELLLRVFRCDAQWGRFICAAIDAEDDFRKERHFVSKARELKTEIVETSLKLRRMLLELGDNADADAADGINDYLDWPRDFFHMRMRRHPLIDGERKKYLSGHKYYHWPLIQPPRDDKLRRREFVLRPADVVGRLIQVAESWEPKPALGMGAAVVVLKSQKSSPKSHLIRSFWFELTHNTASHPLIDDRVQLEWPRSSHLLKAVAATATIVWNRSDDVITYDDVKAAIKIFDKDEALNPPRSRNISLGKGAKNLPK